MGRIVHLVSLLFVCLMLGCETPVSDLHSTNLRCEYLHNPLAIEQKTPRLSWEVKANGRRKSQSAYQILVASSTELLAQNIGDLWNSGKVISDETVNINYRGTKLNSRASCYWKVKVWDQNDVASAWSDNAKWSMGLLHENDWTAQWIGYDEALRDSLKYGTQPWANGVERKKEYRPLPCPYLRKEFDLEKEVSSAKVYITSLGIYEMYLNGVRVGEDYFTPGWTDYNKRIYYNTYDIGNLLKQGANTIAVILADGWYAGSVSNKGQHYYGENLRLKAQIEIQLESGDTIEVISDGSWRAAYGGIREADMQMGEVFDARLEPDGWQLNGFDDGNWSEVVSSDTITAQLQSYPGVPVQQTSEIKPIEVFETRSGVYVVDLGQNFAGWAKIRINETRGDSIVLRYAEKLNPDSSLYRRNLRGARATDIFIANGREEEVWEPRFTYHGFQYIEISGCSQPVTIESIRGVVLHSNLEQTGSFSSSNLLINKIYENIFWSQRSNYFEVPTDCPQRDERAGWLGDAQLFMHTASYNMDVAPFYTKWLVDVSDAQFEGGTISSVAPYVRVAYAAGWGDAAIICPWQLYHTYADTQVIARHYETMKLWMKFTESKSENDLSTLMSFGDWQNVKSETPTKVVATAYYRRSTALMAEMAQLLGRNDDAIEYKNLSENIKRSFTENLVSDSGHVEGRTQTGYLLALAFDLVPDSMRPTLVEHLVDDIISRDTSLSTGILGTHLLLPTLAENGHLDLAYKLLLKTDFPSWGHHIENGATTIWERWDGYSAEKGFVDDDINSFNHYAYGSIGEWFYSTIAGIQSDGPGYKQIIIHPKPGGGITHAEATYKSIRGYIASSWTITGGEFQLNVSIPANTTAKIYMPTSEPNDIREGEQLISQVKDCRVSLRDSKTTLIEVGSGDYSFQAKITE